MANHMAELAKMLGVELGEEFEIDYGGDSTIVNANGCINISALKSRKDKLMYNMGAVTSYVCDKYYYVVYKNDNLIERPIKGLLLNYASGNIVLLADEGIYHIKYNDIILMKPIKNFPLERCSEEFQKLIQSFNTECSNK